MIRSNFTPILDTLVERYDMNTAGVFGKMWRYSQMEDGVCKASQERIASELKITSRTVRNKQAILEKDGLITRIDDNVGGTIVWRVADITLGGAFLGVATPETISDPPRNSFPTTPETISDKESIKIDKEDTLTDQQRMVGSLANVMGMEISLNAGRLGKFAKQLIKAGYTADDVYRCYASPDGIWYDKDWRGKEGQIPNQYHINETIAKYTKVKVKTYADALKEAGYE